MVPEFCAAKGVITNGFALTQFNVGAFSPGVPIVPVCLRYPWRHGAPQQEKANTVKGDDRSKYPGSTGTGAVQCSISQALHCVAGSTRESGLALFSFFVLFSHSPANNYYFLFVWLLEQQM